MCSDYFIEKCLHVYINDIDYFIIRLYKDKNYYHYDFSTDDKDYEKKINKYNKNIVIPQFQPIILYDNYIFKNSFYENKYKYIVKNYLIKYHKTWEDIIKIIIVEERYHTYN